MTMHNQQRSTFYVNRGNKKQKNTKEYTSTLPEGMTDESLREAVGKVVWCKFTACKYNQTIEGVQRTTSDIQDNSSFKPFNEQAHIWEGMCMRKEITIDFKSVISNTGPAGTKVDIPSCHSASTDRRSKMDWSKTLQSDGTPYGGSIESQNPDHMAFSDGGWGSWDSPDDQGSYDGDEPQAPIQSGGSGMFDA